VHEILGWSLWEGLWHVHFFPVDLKDTKECSFAPECAGLAWTTYTHTKQKLLYWSSTSGFTSGQPSGPVPDQFLPDCKAQIGVVHGCLLSSYKLRQRMSPCGSREGAAFELDSFAFDMCSCAQVAVEQAKGMGLSWRSNDCVPAS